MGRPGRLSGYDYSEKGCYFITFCTKARKLLLSDIVGRDDPGAPYVRLCKAGVCLERYITGISAAYPGVTVHKYVIMPNHVHLLLSIDVREGVPRSSRPTQTLPRIIAALKRFVNRDMGCNLWQSTYHDHIIRNEADHLRIWQYIDTNPLKWTEDCYYTEVEC